MIKTIRLVLFHIIFYISVIFPSVCSNVFAFLPRYVAAGLVRAWCDFLLFILKYMVNIDYEFKGMENIPKGPCIFASKHQSFWETLMLYRFMPNGVLITKKQLFFLPLFGTGMLAVGFIPIERGNQASALRYLIRKCKARVKEGHSIIIFPEGTRKSVGAPPDYKAGVAALYKFLNLPVVPIALNSGLYWPRRSFKRNEGTIKVRVLPPIESGLARDVFMERLEGDIETEMKKLI